MAGKETIFIRFEKNVYGKEFEQKKEKAIFFALYFPLFHIFLYFFVWKMNFYCVLRKEKREYFSFKIIFSLQMFKFK